MKSFKEECLEHFNEPMLCGLDVVRCVGYGQDDTDQYVIVQFPTPRARRVWHTGVGGYTFLSFLKQQGVGGEWNDLRRLDEVLHYNGAPKEEKFVEEYHHDGA